MRVLIVSILCLATIGFSGCKNCLNKKGKWQSYSHELQPFTEIDIEGKFNIIIKQDASNSISVSGYQGIIETITYESLDGVLTITNDNKCSNINDYEDWLTIEIGVDSLNHARFSVPGSLSSEGILNWTNCVLVYDNCNLETNLNVNMQDLTVRMDGGTSTINLRGKNYRTQFSSNGNGHIYAKNLISNKLYIYSIGTGILEGTVTDYFLTSIQGSAQVNYYGNPITEIIEILGQEGAQVNKF